MKSTIQRINPSVHIIIGPEGDTNFGIVKANNGSATPIDADIRRIDEVEEALKLTGCSRVGHLVNTHEHFDHTSANHYFDQRRVPIGSAGCVRAMEEEW
jgi:glyoxylase-like metal-dependent hydrolase (beta-lactamase superfamily II)